MGFRARNFYEIEFIETIPMILLGYYVLEAPSLTRIVYQTTFSAREIFSDSNDFLDKVLNLSKKILYRKHTWDDREKLESYLKPLIQVLKQIEKENNFL